MCFYNLRLLSEMTEKDFWVCLLGAVTEYIRVATSRGSHPGTGRGGHPDGDFTPSRPGEKQESWSSSALPRGTRAGKPAPRAHGSWMGRQEWNHPVCLETAFLSSRVLCTLKGSLFCTRFHCFHRKIPRHPRRKCMWHSKLFIV